MMELNHKGLIISLAVLAVFRLVNCRHMMDDGFASGRMVSIQDKVLESCRGHFMCKPFPYKRTLGLSCVHAKYVCDGKPDCPGGEDEDIHECGGGKLGHGLGGLGGSIIYDSHADDRKGDYVIDDILEDFDDEKLDIDSGPVGGGGPLKKGGDSGKKGSKKKGSSRPHVIVIQQPAAAVAPKKAPAPKVHRPLVPMPVPMPYGVRPPMMMPGMPAMPPPMMGMNPEMMSELYD